MKKVLIITNLFHASPRIPGLAKYLPEFGWEPVLLTMPLGDNPESRFGPPNDFRKRVKTYETSFYDVVGFVKRLFGLKPHLSSRDQVKKKFGNATGGPTFMERLVILGAAVLAYPDECRGWRPFAIKAGKDIIPKEKIDIILSSSSPVTSHIISKRLKEKTGVPWVADLRDLWTQNHNYQYPRLRKFFETRLEKQTLSQANVLTTISIPLVEHLKSRYSDKSITSIPNGFDPEIVNEPAAPVTKKFTISYTGTIYYQKQDPTKLFTALHALIDEGKIDPARVDVRFYGIPQEWLEAEIEKYNLKGIATQYGTLSRPDSFKKQRESQALLFYGWEDPKEEGVFPIKMFEYLAARRPVLATGGTSGEKFRDVIKATGVGEDPITVKETKKTLLKYYEDYIKNGVVSYCPNIEAIEEYSYRTMARKFAEVFNKVSK